MTYSTTTGIASRISLARLEKGIDIDVLAAGLGVSPSDMERRLDGMHPWDATEVAQAAVILGARVDYLLLGITKVAS